MQNRRIVGECIHSHGRSVVQSNLFVIPLTNALKIVDFTVDGDEIKLMSVNVKLCEYVKICTTANDQLVLLFLQGDSENQQFACNQIQHLVLTFLSTCFISIHKHSQTFLRADSH